MKSSGYSPLGTMKPSLYQMPIFVSVFMALRYVHEYISILGEIVCLEEISVLSFNHLINDNIILPSASLIL